MAKIKINKLPEGFELVDGKLKKTQVKKDGGYVTGDQADYGLVTTPQEYYGSTNFNNSLDGDVRYSLTGVPREDANVEAEGGETVLADMNSNGQFGLYDINGPRHSSGGVPMFLPEQSFIYSDTNALKFNKDEMSEFGIEAGKKKTPAKISKRYPLNPYLAAINDQYADDISTTSAELMLKKNMNNLSKLAFGQELKKNFEEGVPLAAYPYLADKGIDPIEFTAQVEEISRKQAELNAIASLPPEQQQQVLMLQEMMAQVDQQAPPQEGNPQGNVGPVEQMARYGTELNKAQEGNGEDNGTYSMFNDNIFMFNGRPVQRKEYVDNFIRSGLHIDLDGKVNQNFVNKLNDEERSLYGKALIDVEDYDATNLERFQGDLSIPISSPETVVEEEEVVVDNSQSSKSPVENPFKQGDADYQKFQDAIDRGHVIDLVKRYDPITKRTEYTLIEKPPNPLDSINESEQVNVVTSGTGNTPIYTENDNEVISALEGYPQVKVRRGIASKGDRPENQTSSGPMSAGADLSDPKFQQDFELRWGDAIPEGFDYNTPIYLNEADKAAGRKNPAYTKQWTTVQENMQRLDNEFSDTHGLEQRNIFAGDRGGTDIDGVLGLHTFNVDRRYLADPQSNTITGGIDDPITTPDPGGIDEFVPPTPQPWMQDVNNIVAQNNLDNPLMLPVLGQAPNIEMDITLDDWTGKVNNINAALNSKLNNLQAFGKGAVAGSDYGKAVALSEDAINKTNTNNIGIINRAAGLNAQLNMQNNQFNMKQREAQDEGTNLALQRFTDFENWDTIKSNDLFNRMQTNMVNTANLNKTKSKEYQIDPLLYGLNTFTGDTDPNQRTDQTSETAKREAEQIRLWDLATERGVPEDDRLDWVANITGNIKNKKDDDDSPFEKYNAVPSVIPPAKRGGMTKLKRTAYPYWMTVGKMGR
tara:strand:+ start:6 stop:2786 length:2781 start_codon:yes stop_codon:yes gene_type:complete